MTWFADEIFAPASDEVIRVVRSDTRLAPFAYQLKGALEFPWHKAEVAHDLPRDGLIVVRPVCNADTSDDPAHWYRKPVLDWESFPGQAGAEPLVDRAMVEQECKRALPPVGLLSYLKGLSVQTQSPFIYYSCFMHGGTVEYEYAWVFGQSEVVLINPLSNPVMTVILEPLKSKRLLVGDTLALALGYLQLALPTPYFAPHDCTFPWDRYRLMSENS